LEEVGELNSLFDPTGPPPEAAPAPRPALSLSGELQRSPGQLPPPYIGGFWGGAALQQLPLKRPLRRGRDETPPTYGGS